MPQLRRVGAMLVIGLLSLTAVAEAQNCKKGIPCGNSCISASRTCRIGSGSSAPIQPSPTAAQARDESTSRGFVDASPASGLSADTPTYDENAPWVASKADSIYFRRNCSAAADLAVPNRRSFATEMDARARGFRRSRVLDC